MLITTLGKQTSRNQNDLLSKYSTPIFMEQVHSAKIQVVESPTPQTFLRCDAVITSQPNVTLFIKTADCLPIFITHPSGIRAALHAGRKGTQLQILKKTLELLNTKYEVQSTISIWFGPRICNECYQIDRETDLHYDLIAQNQKQINDVLKVGDYNLIIHPDCTVCQNDTWHSYRKGETGRNYFGLTTS